MRLLSIVSAAAITAAAFLATPDALAQRNRNNQATTAVVLNYQRVLAESRLGRDLSAKLATIRNQVSQEAQALLPEGQAIEQERQRLAGLSRNMTSEQVRNNATLAPQFEQLAQRLQAFQQRTQGLQGDMECTQLLTLRDFDRQVSPIVRQIMEGRGAGVVLDATQVQLVLPEYDITTTVIQALDQNSATQTATVSRHSVSECQAQQQPAAPPAQ